MKKLTKKQKKIFKRELQRTMCIIRGAYDKISDFSARQKKSKMWEELK